MTHPTDAASLAQHLSHMQPGDTLNNCSFDIVDEDGNHVDLRNTRILCRERHSTKKNPEKIKQAGYRFEVFINEPLGYGSNASVYPIASTLKLNEQGHIEVLKSAKQRVVKKLYYPLMTDETLIGVNIPYLHMKPLIRNEYIVMRKIPGETLSRLLSSADISHLPEETKFLLLLGLLEELKNLHQQKIFHWDLTTGNIMVNFESADNLKPQIYIIDFGLATKEKSVDDQATDEIYQMGIIFRKIRNAVSINNPELDQLIKDMRSSHRSPISLQSAIYRLKTIFNKKDETIVATTETNPISSHPITFFKAAAIQNPIQRQEEEITVSARL